VIALGYRDSDKREAIRAYCMAHAIRQTIVISANAFPLELDGAEHVPYSEVIMYRTFYPLLQKIDKDTLVVVNECLRNQNRYDLAYNCIRNYLNQTPHALVFQQLPQIDSQEDFMILFDFATQSRWKRIHFDPDLVAANTEVDVRPLPITFTRIPVPTSRATRDRYEVEKVRLFSALGAGDPHVLPRNLYLVGGRDKLGWIEAAGQPGLFDAGSPTNYVGRNSRLNRPNIVTYLYLIHISEPTRRTPISDAVL